MDDTLAQRLSIRQTGPGQFEPAGQPVTNYTNVAAYGGWTIGIAVKAAYQTVSPGYHLYSLLGNFLSSPMAALPLICSVESLRDTNTFATRRIELYQQHKGKKRIAMIASADFHAQEPASALTYTTAPSMKWPHYADLTTFEDWYQGLVKQQKAGKLPKRAVVAQSITYAQIIPYFNFKMVPDSMAAQTLNGALKTAKTTQDDLSISSRASADWTKARENITDEALNLAATAYNIDGCVPFVALPHTSNFFDDVAAISSLEFAFRVFRNNVKMDQWHLREIKTMHGGEGRSYSECRLWNEQGDMVASMTQQAIIRPKITKATL